LLPLIQGTGYAAQAARRRTGPPTPRPKPVLPPGFTAEPDATPQPGGFPVVQLSPDGVPAALSLPNPEIEPILDAEKNGTLAEQRRPDVFQLDWIDACKGLSNNVTHGTSSKTHCDFDYAGSMMEQMLLGLVAHHAGKRLEYDPATGRVTNDTEANSYLKRTYRSGWSLNG
jgi:hypothetical protein